MEYTGRCQNEFNVQGMMFLQALTITMRAPSSWAARKVSGCL
jgi:hypothetical protein